LLSLIVAGGRGGRDLAIAGNQSSRDMGLELNDSEIEVIGRVLRNYLGDLRMEIRDTEDHDFRAGLKQDEQVITSFLARLPASSASQGEGEIRA
jgi:hypothetical protein